jgi:hypothetical protein
MGASAVVIEEVAPVGARYSVAGSDQARCTESWVLMFRILYRFLALLARLAVRSARSKDLEIMVLRHQLTVLQRQNSQPQLNDHDRTVLGAIAAALPAGCVPGGSSRPTPCFAGTDVVSPDTGPNPTDHQAGRPPPPRSDG